MSQDSSLDIDDSLARHTEDVQQKQRSGIRKPEFL